MMDAVEFHKVRKRMCDEYKAVCTKCPLVRKWVCTMGKYVEEKEAREAVEIVEKWAEEHPAKTYKSEFMRAAEYVGAKPLFSTPPACIKHFFGEEVIPPSCASLKCSDCWNREIEQ